MIDITKNIYWVTIKETVKKFIEDNPFRHSAAIAYYAIFSLPGIAMISVAIASSFYSQEVVRAELLNQVTLLMGKSSAEQVGALMDKTLVDGKSLIMKIVSVVTLVISATTVLISLQDSLNSIWKIKPVPKKAVVGILLKRVLSLAMIASVGFLVLVSLMADTLVAIIKFTLDDYLSSYSYYIIWVVNAIVTFSIFTSIFAVIYKILPDANIKWGDVKLGAIVTTVLFVSGKYLIGYYLSHSDLSDTYGAAGSLVVLLAWVYYSVLILIFGAQFTFVYNKERGRTIRPNKGAVAIEIIEVKEYGKAVTDL